MPHKHKEMLLLVYNQRKVKQCKFEFILKIEKNPLQLSVLQTTLRQFVIYKKIKQKISIIYQRHEILGIDKLAVVLVSIKLNREKTGLLQN